MQEDAHQQHIDQQLPCAPKPAQCGADGCRCGGGGAAAAGASARPRRKRGVAAAGAPVLAAGRRW